MQDGRDVPDGTSIKFVEALEKDLESLDGVDAKIASGGGRMHVTMDRYEVSCKHDHSTRPMWFMNKTSWHTIGHASHAAIIDGPQEQCATSWLWSWHKESTGRRACAG